MSTLNDVAKNILLEGMAARSMNELDKSAYSGTEAGSRIVSKENGDVILDRKHVHIMQYDRDGNGHQYTKKHHGNIAEAARESIGHLEEHGHDSDAFESHMNDQKDWVHVASY